LERVPVKFEVCKITAGSTVLELYIGQA